MFDTDGNVHDLTLDALAPPTPDQLREFVAGGPTLQELLAEIGGRQSDLDAFPQPPVSPLESAGGKLPDISALFVADTQVDDIIITAEGGGGWWDHFPYNPWPTTSGGGGGGGGDPDTMQEPEGYDRCQDREADALAAEINAEIAAQPDAARREYGSLIWKDASGALHRTPLIAGTNQRVNWGGALNPAQGFTSFSQVVGVVHSHPTEIESEEGAGDWHAPDSTDHFELIWAGDWRSADGFVFGDPQDPADDADWANFTMYISYQGEVREFDWWQNMLRSRDPISHPNGEGTESGDYDPDGTCA